MIDVLLAAEIDGEKLAFADVVSNAMLLVQAGLETTASAMSFAFHYLGTHPDERDRLIGEPEIMSRAMTFGGGVHYCLGANLARLELAEALKIFLSVSRIRVARRRCHGNHCSASAGRRVCRWSSTDEFYV